MLSIAYALRLLIVRVRVTGQYVDRLIEMMSDQVVGVNPNLNSRFYPYTEPPLQRINFHIS